MFFYSLLLSHDFHLNFFTSSKRLYASSSFSARRTVSSAYLTLVILRPLIENDVLFQFYVLSSRNRVRKDQATGHNFVLLDINIVLSLRFPLLRV